MIRSQICRMLGIRYPVFQGGMARRMVRLEASALIAEGGESGSHVGELTTMALVPQVCDTAGGLPRGSRRHRGRPRGRRCIYAGCLRCADGHMSPQRGGVHHSSRLPGKDPESRGPLHHGHGQAPGASGA